MRALGDLVNPDEAVILCGDFNINSRGNAHDFIWTKKFLKGAAWHYLAKSLAVSTAF